MSRWVIVRSARPANSWIAFGRSFTWRSVAPGLSVFGHHAVAPAEGGARATLGLHYEGRFGTLLARMTRGITNRYLDFEAAGLKRRSEELARPRADETAATAGDH